MKKRKSLIKFAVAAILSLGSLMVCLTSCKSNGEPRNPDKPSDIKIGTYIWGDDLYKTLGAGGAKILAEMYSKTNIKIVHLLVKGTTGTVGFLANPYGEYKPARTDCDMLQEVITAMHEKDIKVYAWIYCSEDTYYGENHPDENCYHFRTGTQKPLPDINSAAFSDYLARMIRVIRDNYQVDGILFDHLRYNGLYYGWGEKDYIAMTTDPDINMSLDEYNEAVKLMAATFNYPIAPNNDGRYVYNAENPTIHENNPTAIYDAAEKDNVAVLKLMKYRELAVDRISEKLLKECAGIPTMYASMPEVVTTPIFATLSYGTTINDTRMFTYQSPMLYTKEFGEGKEWVKKGCEFLLRHQYKCIPSLQAHDGATTASLATDIKAAISSGCNSYNLFRSFVYDIARVTVSEDNNICIKYLKGANSDNGSISVTVSDASKIKSVIVDGKFAGEQYTLSGNTLTISGDKLQNIGDEGVIYFTLTDKISVTEVNSNNVVWLDVD